VINRLLQIEIQGFRSILQRQVLSLDADVVIIYGPNGTGKSGILAAIEYGLTGTVSDLIRFADDYPRCLTHVRSMTPGEVAITFRTDHGNERLRAVVGRTSEPAEGRLSDEERQSYIERCFLSQSRLSRLIDNYLDTGESGGEQKILRFGRELLGLDVLESLATGLFEIADVRRIRNNSADYQQLVNDRDAANEEVQRLERAVQLRTASFDSAVQSFQNLLRQPISGTTLDVLEARVDELEATQSAERSRALSRFRGLDARLQSVIALIEASGAGQFLAIEDIDKDLSRVNRDLGDAERQLRPVIEGLERDLIAEDLWISTSTLHQGPNSADLGSQIAELESMLKRRLGAVELELKSLDGLESERRTIESRLAEVTSKLAVLSEMTPASVQEQRQWVDVLRIVASRVHSTDCPVCGRDYSELGVGSLREKVLHDADQIARVLQEAEKIVSSRVALQTDQKELGQRLAALMTQIDRSSHRRVELERIASRYRERLTAVTASSEIRLRHGSLTLEKRRLESIILENRVRLDQHKQALAEAETIAKETAIEEFAGTRVPSIDAAKAIRDALIRRIAALQAEEKESFQLRESAILTRSLRADLTGLRSQLEEQRARHSRLDSGCRHVELVIQRARSLRSAAIETKSELLNQAFTVSLNRQWREFFERLARAERFRPEMSEPAAVRNVIRSTVGAVAANTERFVHLGSVLSAGNLNTAALSLFLALHVMDRTSHHLLVLDDPVQNADDVHISQLAILLRALMTQIGRQIIVAVHDRDLFDYLSLELAPLEQGRRLISVEIQRTGAESDVQILQRTKEWAPTVRFGT
jgi:exonuclease SbcC